MRFMIIRRADSRTEAGVMPSEALLSAMGAYNQAMIEAGVFRAGEAQDGWRAKEQAFRDRAAGQPG